MVAAEMIPLQATSLSFWDKFFELQYKMFFNHQENIQNHMYSSDPIEWPLTGRGIAYWVSSEHNVSSEKTFYLSFLVLLDFFVTRTVIISGANLLTR